MTTRERLKQQIDSFDESKIQQLAEFVEFLQYRDSQKAALLDRNTESDDTPDEEILTNFKQAWHEAMIGQTIPISQVWEELENA
jgi:hypothetical protein